MSAAEKLKYTTDEYFALTAEGEKEGKRYEFHDGEVFIISDASIEHNQLLNATSSTLTVSLKTKPCQVMGQAQQIHVKTQSFYCYPDIVVICGPIETLQHNKNIITNPTVIVEVLSATTQDYDRGEKFRLYRAISTLQEYVCISSLQMSLEKYSRQPNEFWILKEYNNPDDIIALDSLGISLRLGDLYEKVVF